MRQRVGAKKVARLRKQTGLPVYSAQVRGNTGHRIDLFLENGEMWCLWPDGTLRKSEYQNCLAVGASVSE